MAVALVYGDIESSMKQAKTIIENIRELKWNNHVSKKYKHK
jgi:hypothetical protein